MKPESTGSVMITSKDPKDAPAIDSAFLKETVDVQNMVKAVAKARELGKAAPLAEMTKTCTTDPTVKGDTDEEKNQKFCPYLSSPHWNLRILLGRRISLQRD